MRRAILTWLVNSEVPQMEKKKKMNSRNSCSVMMETSPPSCVSIWSVFLVHLFINFVIQHSGNTCKIIIRRTNKTKKPNCASESERRAPRSCFPQMLVFLIRPVLEGGLRRRSGVMRMGFCGDLRKSVALLRCENKTNTEGKLQPGMED